MSIFKRDPEKAAAKAAEREAAELAERSILAQAEEYLTLNGFDFTDDQKGWSKQVVMPGQNNGRSTLTRVGVGTVLLPGVGTVLGGMSKKRKNQYRLYTLDENGIVVRDQALFESAVPLHRRQAVQFNKLHRVLPDGSSKAERDARASALDKRVKQLRKNA